MKLSLKAALLSGLAFPGTGHFILKQYLRGLIFFLPSLISLLYLLRYSVNKANALAAQIAQGNIPLDAAVIGKAITASPAGTELAQLEIAAWILLVSWLLGIVDSFRQGQLADRNIPEQ
jgi:hypothetical protein